MKPVASMSTADCLKIDVSDQYINPCQNLTTNQFGFKDMGSLQRGGSKRRKMRLTRRQASKMHRLRRKIHRGGDCSKPIPDCFGNTLKNLSNNSYVGSEDAWAHRYTVGVGSGDTANIVQKGGGYRLSVNSPRIGGLSEIQSIPEPLLSSNSTNVTNSRNTLYGGRRYKRRRSNKQYGGDPAPYQTAFDGQTSIFTDNMNQRDFACKQPTWKPSCV